MSVFRKTERTARRPHRCIFCARGIAAGARYIDGFALVEGQPAPWKAHPACQEIADYAPWGDEGVPPFAEWEPEDIAELPERQRRAFDSVAGGTP